MNDEDEKIIEGINSQVKIDWTNFALIADEMINEPTSRFEISPEQYLKYAKEDFALGCPKNLINALGNAKRAIDSHTDLIINAFGFTDDNFKGSSETRRFINQYYVNDQNEGLTDKIKLLQILGFSPSFLISKIRKIRNGMEHDYVIPSKSEVLEAIEIAELFINASMRRFLYFNSDIEISSNYTINNTGRTKYIEIDGQMLHLKFNEDNKVIDVNPYKRYTSYSLKTEWKVDEGGNDYMGTKEDVPEDVLNECYSAANNIFGYLVFLNVMATKNMICLKEYLGNKTPDEKLKYVISYDLDD